MHEYKCKIGEKCNFIIYIVSGINLLFSSNLAAQKHLNVLFICHEHTCLLVRRGPIKSKVLSCQCACCSTFTFLASVCCSNCSASETLHLPQLHLLWGDHVCYMGVISYVIGAAAVFLTCSQLSDLSPHVLCLPSSCPHI